MLKEFKEKYREAYNGMLNSDISKDGKNFECVTEYDLGDKKVKHNILYDIIRDKDEYVEDIIKLLEEGKIQRSYMRGLFEVCKTAEQGDLQSLKFLKQLLNKDIGNDDVDKPFIDTKQKEKIIQRNKERNKV